MRSRSSPRSMPVETQTVPFLLLVGQRLEFLGRDAIPFFKRVQRRTQRISN